MEINNLILSKVSKEENKVKKIMRLIFGIILGLFIHYVSLFLIPSIRFIGGFIEKHPFITRGDVTQTSFLILSLVLIILFTRGKVSNYGLKGVKLGKLKNPVLFGIVWSFAAVSIGAVLRIIIDSPGGNDGEMMMPGGLLKPILSVWILASISEEIFFRGFLQSFFMPLKQYGLRLFKAYLSAPVMICAVWFGLGHLGLLSIMSSDIVIAIVLNAIVLGLLAGYYREKTGSIIPAIVVHMIFNIVGSFITVILTRIIVYEI